MFSSGFFLLPGVAAAQTGPSVILAYLVAGALIVPAMLSVAELSTAMPRTGGAYYFLDRALGPVVGMVGGLGAWFALVLKTAFALVGMGAYLALLIDVPITPVALVLTGMFAAVNIVGAKETTALQRVLVTALVVILLLFLVQGVGTVLTREAAPRGDGVPVFTAGLSGFMATVGLVFVSYMGLTKVASVAGEIRRPERNIPLGMALSLVTATAIYVAGVAVLVGLLEFTDLAADLTPVATAAGELSGWVPASVSLALIVVAAVAAFASTGNAGILSASRFPLAMSSDGLLPSAFGTIGRFGTPTLSIGATAAAIALSVLLLDVAAIAKLASAFVLLLFALLNLAVVVMRESRIDAYLPPFRSPLYPWMQVAGMLIPFWLIAEMGELAVLFTLGVVAAGLVLYFVYAKARVERSGAIYHAFERLGRNRFDGLDRELREIVMEQGLREGDPYDLVVARAHVLDLERPASAADVVVQASDHLSRRTGVPADELVRELELQATAERAILAPGIAVPHARFPDMESPALILVRCRDGIRFPSDGPGTAAQPVHAAIVLVSPRDRPGLHLRLLGHLAMHLDRESFLDEWLAAPGPESLKYTLLREEHHLFLRLGADGTADQLIGKRLAETDFPSGSLVAAVHRGNVTFVPDGDTVLHQGDTVTVIGEASLIRSLEERFLRSPTRAPTEAPVGTFG
jgi:amino acid transporter/mannitol/fructose-specific phosphotransferase system IIA component (Ntr-type)